MAEIEVVHFYIEMVGQDRLIEIPRTGELWKIDLRINLPTPDAMAHISVISPENKTLLEFMVGINNQYWEPEVPGFFIKLNKGAKIGFLGAEAKVTLHGKFYRNDDDPNFGRSEHIEEFPGGVLRDYMRGEQ